MLTIRDLKQFTDCKWTVSVSRLFHTFNIRLFRLFICIDIERHYDN